MEASCFIQSIVACVQADGRARLPIPLVISGTFCDALESGSTNFECKKSSANIGQYLHLIAVVV